MLTRIWKEDAKGRMVKGSLREVEIRFDYKAKGTSELECLPPKEIKPYVRQAPPIYVKVRKRRQPLKKKTGNA